MSTLAEYLAFAKAHPTLFVNPPEESITILLNEDEIREAEATVARRLEAQWLPAEWARVGIAFRDQSVFLLRDAVCFPGDFLGTYFRLISEEDDPRGVIMLPVYQQQVLLIRHFRHWSRIWHLEVPQGFGIPGLSSEEAIHLELQEEINATVSRLVSLGRFHPDTHVGANAVELFYIDIESYGDVELQEGIAELLPTPVPEFERMIRDNEIIDGFTLAAYAQAKLKGLF